jgi:hypothetical protein
MASVVLTFAPAAEHVRTARLVAVAVARRAGVDEACREDIRLAVGELCARAVGRCLAAPPPRPGPGPAGRKMRWTIRLTIEDEATVFRVSVSDPVGPSDPSEDSIGLAMAAALADGLEILDDPENCVSTIRLTWHSPEGRPEGRRFRMPHQ